MNLKLTAAMCLLSVAMSSCTIYSTAFVPNTMDSARCKKDCTVAYQDCHLANCEARHVTCMDYCMDIDRIATNKAKR